MKSCNIFLLRHLKTLNNDLQIISGQSDSKIIDTNFLQLDLHFFDKIYCSPSTRCVQTIEKIDIESSISKSIVYDRRLLERFMGSLEGMSKKNCKKVYPNLFEGGVFNVFETPPHGESFDEFKSRVHAFYEEYVCRNEQKNILICSHNQTLKMLRLFIIKEAINYQSWTNYSFKNGELVKVL